MEKRHNRKHLWNLENNFILLKNKGLRYIQIYSCAQSLKRFHQKLSDSRDEKAVSGYKKKTTSQ
jgi:hypothetical protein